MAQKKKEILLQPTVTVSNSGVPARHRAGRKQRLGALVFNPSTQSMGTLVAYCSHCDEKVIASREELNELGYRLRKNGKSFKTRILLRLLKSIELTISK